MMKMKWKGIPQNTQITLKKGVGRLSSLLVRLLIYVFLISCAFVILYPVLYMLSMAFRPAEDMTNPNVVWIPTRLTLSNIKGIWDYVKYPELLKNTLLLCGVSTLLQGSVCCLVGYGFARFKFRFKGIAMALLLLTVVLPPQATSISNYLLMTDFNPMGLISLFNKITGQDFRINLYDTVGAFWLPAATGMGIRSGIFILIYRQFFRNLPGDLEDAAYIDGSGPFRSFFRIMLPLCASAMVIVFLFSLVWYWNDTFYATSYFDSLKTVSVKLSELKEDITRFLPDLNGQDPYASLVWLQAGVAISIAPMLGLYLICQKFFVESIERTGLVG